MKVQCLDLEQAGKVLQEQLANMSDSEIIYEYLRLEGECNKSIKVVPAIAKVKLKAGQLVIADQVEFL